MAKQKNPAQNKKETVAVEFKCPPVPAEAVFLAGSFNGWSETATPMARDDSGGWLARLDLAPGRHEFKFLIDGEWRCGPELLAGDNAATCVPNEFGTLNFAIETGVPE